MKKIFASVISIVTGVLLSCCSTVPTASLGAGAHAGKDYVTGLRPSAAARQYFTSMDPNAPVETISRGGAESRSGVRFVANDGILIPPGVTISFSHQGYCLDPHLPAPRAGDEYQLIPASAMIPNSLRYTYQNLVKRAAAGDSAVRGNMQGLVWAIRTAGTNDSHASHLTAAQKRILDSCSARPGDFERIHQNGLRTERLLNEAWKMADSALNVRIGNHTWKASDLSSPAAFNSAVDSQLRNLIALGDKLPVQHTGFNYGELEPGIYTDIRGDGHLSFTAQIANNSDKDFIFYPANYVAQVGNGSALTSVAFGAAAGNGKKQHVSLGPLSRLFIRGVAKKLERQAKKAEPFRGTPFKSQTKEEKKKQIEMAALAASVYGDEPYADQLLAGSDYKLEDSRKKHDCVSSIYVNENDKAVYVVFRGTASFSDIKHDVELLINPWASTDIYKRYEEALNRTKQAINSHPGYSVTLVGHSLGGSMVQHVMNRLPSSDLRAYTFNSYGLVDAKTKLNDSRMTDIVNGTEFINQWGLMKNARRSGKRIMVGDSSGNSEQPSPWNNEHSINSTLFNMWQDRN